MKKVNRFVCIFLNKKGRFEDQLHGMKL